MEDPELIIARKRSISKWKREREIEAWELPNKRVKLKGT